MIIMFPESLDSWYFSLLTTVLHDWDPNFALQLFILIALSNILHLEQMNSLHN